MLRRLGALALGLIHADHLGFAAIQSVLLQVLTVVANLATGVMTARLLGPAGRGHYAAAVTWPSLLGMAAAAGTADAVLVHLRRSPADKAATVAWGGLVTLVAAFVLSALAWTAMPTLLGPAQSDAVPTARAALTLVFLIGTATLARDAFAGRGRYRLTNLGAFLPHCLHALTMAVFAGFGALTVQTAVLSLILGQSAALFMLLPMLVREFEGPLTGVRRSIAAVSSFARRAAPGDLLSLLPLWADRLLLILLLSPAALGLYTVAYGFSRVVTIATPASGLLLSAMSGERRAAAKQLHDTAVRFCIASIVVTLGPAIALSGPLVRLFYGAEFLRAAPVFQLLVLQAACGRLVGVTAQFYRALDRPALASGVELAGVLTSAALILSLVPAYGALGAAIGMLGGTVLRLVLLWGGLVVQLGVPLPRLWLSFEDLRSARQLFTS